MNDANAKQQIVEKIKSSTNILVTLSTNPSVDELSAALGLTLLLNKMKKHATAVFSGAIPAAITFLDPQKTFEGTVDSLRDFIIALDKEKADHLRYKVDGEVVKIFITPYRTTITNQDLEFSQGDYNVELILALGVKQRDNLDKALSAHGRILHDATVATMSAGEKSDLGSIDWHDTNASSLSEMLVGLTDSLKGDKSLLDEQIATAFLTGVVAATDRFSNNKTSSRVMTMAAQLMAAGANQQLIAAKLEDAHEIGSSVVESPKTEIAADESRADGTMEMSEGESTKLSHAGNDKVDAPAPSLPPTPPPSNDGSLAISHDTDDAVASAAAETTARAQQEAAAAAEEDLAQQLPTVAPIAAAPLEDLAQALQTESTSEPAQEEPVAPELPPLRGPVSDSVWKDSNQQAPMMGGTLNATTEQAADEKRKAEDDDRNRTILHHGSGDYIGDAPVPSFQAPLNSVSADTDEDTVADIFASSPHQIDDGLSYEESPQVSQKGKTLEEIDQQNRQPHAEERAAIDAAFGAVPFTPANNPQVGLGAQPFGLDIHQNDAQSSPSMPPLPDFSTLPPPLPPLSQAPMPDATLAPEKLEDMFAPPADAPQEPSSNDPGQFKIPGQ